MKIEIINEVLNKDKIKGYARNSGGIGPMIYHSIISGVWSRPYKGRLEQNKFEFLMYYCRKDEKTEELENEIKKMIQKDYTKEIVFKSFGIMKIRLMRECGRRYK